MNKLWHDPNEPEDSGDPDEWFQMEAQRDAEPPDINEIEKVMLESAGWGNADAQFELGTFYYFSEKHDPIKSKEWLLKAAKQDFAQAQHALWRMHDWGADGSLGFKEAVRWLRRAAELDLADAQFELSGLYMLGREGIEHDMDEVMNWLHKAAEQDHPGAQFGLSSLYYGGNGVEKDLKKAIRWLRQSAEGGDSSAQLQLGGLYYRGEGVEQSFDKAFEWSHKSAEQGDADAQCYLGVLYYQGEGVSQDSQEAAKWFGLAAEAGDACAQGWLANLYYNGEGVEQDLEQALMWMHLSAEQGYDYAQCELGNYYYGQEDFQEAAQWYEKSAEQGYADAQCYLGVLYMNGEGVERNMEQALKYLHLSVEQGFDQAQLELGKYYYFEQNFVKAFEWDHKSAERGDADAHKKASVRIGLPDQQKGAPEALPVPASGGALYPGEIHFEQIPTLSHIDIVNEVYEESRGHEEIKIVIDNEIYWKLITASYRGIESCFALTKDPEIEPLFQLTSKVNADWKIILMPLGEKTACPTPEQFNQMKDYFLDEGYFENLKIWTDRLNQETVRLNDDNLKDLLTKTNPQEIPAEIDK